jgi:hypothetical protein
MPTSTSRRRAAPTRAGRRADHGLPVSLPGASGAPAPDRVRLDGALARGGDRGRRARAPPDSRHGEDLQRLRRRARRARRGRASATPGGTALRPVRAARRVAVVPLLARASSPICASCWRRRGHCGATRRTTTPAPTSPCGWSAPARSAAPSRSALRRWRGEPGRAARFPARISSHGRRVRTRRAGRLRLARRGRGRSTWRVLVWPR